jgi:hypothetical protein
MSAKPSHIALCFNARRAMYFEPVDSPLPHHVAPTVSVGTLLLIIVLIHFRRRRPLDWAGAPGPRRCGPGPSPRCCGVRSRNSCCWGAASAKLCWLAAWVGAQLARSASAISWGSTAAEGLWRGSNGNGLRRGAAGSGTKLSLAQSKLLNDSRENLLPSSVYFPLFGRIVKNVICVNMVVIFSSSIVIVGRPRLRTGEGVVPIFAVWLRTIPFATGDFR